MFERKMFKTIFQELFMSFPTFLLIFSQTRPIFKSVDNIQFRKPVEVGDLLYLSSQVCVTAPLK